MRTTHVLRKTMNRTTQKLQIVLYRTNLSAGLDSNFLCVSTASALIIERSCHYWAIYYGNRVPFTDHSNICIILVNFYMVLYYVVYAGLH